MSDNFWDNFRKKRSDWLIEKFNLEDEAKYPKAFPKFVRFFNEDVIGFFTSITIFILLFKLVLKINELKGIETTIIMLLLMILFAIKTQSK